MKLINSVIKNYKEFEIKNFEESSTPKIFNSLAKYGLRFIITLLLSYFLVFQFLVFNIILNYLGIYNIIGSFGSYCFDYSIRLFAIFTSPIILYILLFSRSKVTFHIFPIVLTFAYLNQIVIDCFINPINTIVFYSLYFTIAACLFHFLILKITLSISKDSFLNFYSDKLDLIKNKANYFSKTLVVTIHYLTSIWIYLNIIILLGILISFESVANQYDVYETILKILVLLLLPIIYITAFSRDKITIHPYILSFAFFIITYNSAPFPVYFILSIVFITTSVIQIIHYLAIKLTKVFYK